MLVWTMALTELRCCSASASSFLCPPLPSQSCWCHFLFPFQDRTSLAQLLRIDFSKTIDWTWLLFCSVLPVSTSCVFPVLTAFVVSSPHAVARAEECIWWSYPGCPWATRDAEKEEMLYILKCWNSSRTCLFLALWMCCYSNLSYVHRLSKQDFTAEGNVQIDRRLLDAICDAAIVQIPVPPSAFLS